MILLFDPENEDNVFIGNVGELISENSALLLSRVRTCEIVIDDPVLTILFLLN